jgi:hypothetical protein
MKFPFSFRAKTPADKLPEQTPQQHPEQKPAASTVAGATTLRPQAGPVSQAPQVSDAGATTNAVPTQLQASPSPQAVAPQAPAAQVAPAVSPASPAASTTAASPTTPIVGQMDSMAMSAEDIIAAYKIFLKRVPESMEVVTPRVGLSAERVLFDFMSSGEFTNRPEVANLVFAVGKKILDERAAKNPAPATAATTAPAPDSAPMDAPTVSADQTSTPTPTSDPSPKTS